MRILKLALLILLIYLCAAAYLFFVQRSLLYFPPPPNHHGYPEESFLFEEARVQVIVLNKGHQNAILYFGGNAEAVERNAPSFMKNFPNHMLYLMQYRGYGNSTGEPTEANLYADSLIVFDKIKQRHHSISVIGRSLGSGVATYLAANRKIHKLALITPYDSIEAMAQSLFPLFPMSILLQDKYNALAHAQQIKAPTLLLIAENDQTIPLAHSQKLANAFAYFQALSVIIPDSNHNNISYHPLYITQLQQFINTPYPPPKNNQ